MSGERPCGPENPERPGGTTAGQASRRMQINTLWNLLGTGLPIILALITIPVLINSIGTARFGAFAIAWTVLSYFGLLDLGIGRSTIKFMSEAFENGRTAEARSVLWSSVVLSSALGLVSGLVLILGSGFLVGLLNIDPGLRSEVVGGFRVLGLGIPLVTITQSLTGTLEAQHKFRLYNTLQVPNSALTQAAPLFALPFTQNLTWLIGALVLARLWGTGVFFIAAVRQFERPFSGPFFLREKFRSFFSYSSWQAVTNVISPIMVNSDRLVLGALVSLSAVAYYATPAEAVNRLAVVSQSLGRTAFPIFSSEVDVRRRTLVHSNAVKFLAVATSLAAATMTVFAYDALALWINPEFALRSAPVLQILAIGLLANSIATISFVLVQGIGRADVTAKFHVLELILYLPLLYLGVRYFGVEGAALAWAFRTVLDCVLLTAYAHVCGGLDGATVRASNLYRVYQLCAVPLAAGWLLDLLTADFALKCVLWAIGLLVFTYLTWANLFTPDDRGLISNYTKSLTSRLRRSTSRG